MGTVKREIELNPAERKELQKYVQCGKKDIRIVCRAHIILDLDRSIDTNTMTNAQVAEKYGVSRQTIQMVKNRFFESHDIKDFLSRKKRETPPVPAKVNGEVEAYIIALACSAAPKGYSKWNLRLLADKSVELGYCDALSHMTVSRVLKKHNLSLT